MKPPVFYTPKPPQDELRVDLFSRSLAAFLWWVLLLAFLLFACTSCTTIDPFSVNDEMNPAPSAVSPVAGSEDKAGGAGLTLPDGPRGIPRESLFPEQPVRSFAEWLLTQVRFHAGYEPEAREAYAAAMLFGYGPRLGVSIITPPKQEWVEMAQE